eukprot:1159972-Pelagomonas_calceolata.AAC.19
MHVISQKSLFLKVRWLSHTVEHCTRGYEERIEGNKEGHCTLDLLILISFEGAMLLTSHVHMRGAQTEITSD